MRILIVEDEFVSRAKLQKILSSYGECNVAVNGREAIEMFRMALKSKEYYDVIIMDILMPEMDGHEALQEIRDIEKDYLISGLEHVKVIMITALTDEENITKAYLDGRCEAYLEKPIDKEKLMNVMRELELVDV